MENTYDDLLIVTIVIQTHGKVLTYELNSRTADIFHNTRLLCRAGDFVDIESFPAREFSLVSELKKHFSRDLDSSTYDVIRNIQKGIIIDNITFDKSLSTITGEPTLSDYFSPIGYVQGVYLLSIHSGRRLIYPDNPDEKVINLMKVSDLNKLAKKFKTKVPNIPELSTPFPIQTHYIDEENTIKNNETIPEDEKEEMIKNIRRQFYNNLSNWQLTLNKDKIISLKLSTLVEIVKIIIGTPCFINLLDYSCNSPTTYMPENQKLSGQYALQEPDIETGMYPNTKYGGLKKTRQRKKKTNRNRKKIKIGKQKTKRVKGVKKKLL